VKCYFLRHGPAADAQTWRGADDDRPLTADGKKRVAREAKTLAALALDLDAIVTSPLLRAKQTAEIVANALKLPVVEDTRLGLGFGIRALRTVLADRSEAGAILLVGHEPSMSTTIGSVIGGARIDLKKGALACVDFPDPDTLEGELLSLVPPKVLAL
jgi:phosphohistidine phosphatase